MSETIWLESLSDGDSDDYGYLREGGCKVCQCFRKFEGDGVKVSRCLTQIEMTQNFKTESLFLMKKYGFEEEFLWLKKLGKCMEYLPLFIGKMRETF